MRTRARTILIALCALLAFAAALPAGAAGQPPIRHVFILFLENENADSTFAPNSPTPYLSQVLPDRGAFLPNFYAVTHLSLGNYLALVSGQGSNPQTQADCQVFTEFAGTVFGANGQLLGQGCVYPSSVETLADQLSDEGLTWNGYMEDMGNDRTRESETCAHPPLNQADPTQEAEVGDQYAARHNPFVYFHSIIDSPDCDRNVVPLDRLIRDLRSVRATANFSFITPNLCHDGHDEPCVNGEPGGLVSMTSSSVCGSRGSHARPRSSATACCSSPSTRRRPGRAVMRMRAHAATRRNSPTRRTTVVPPSGWGAAGSAPSRCRGSSNPGR